MQTPYDLRHLSATGKPGDVHLAVVCVATWQFYFSMLTVSAWKNVMGAMAKGDQSKKTPWKHVMAPITKNQ